MIKNEIKFFFLIILIIIIYDIYILYFHKLKLEPVKNTIHKIEKIVNINNNDQNDDSYYNLVDINLYGKPYEHVENKYIIWIAKPWNKIIYKYNETSPFYFFIKIKIPSLNNYLEWKKIINNLDFNQQSGEIILSTNDEETALSIINLMILNFKGEISFQEIIDKNLIDISINKSKKSEQIKNKLIELIIENTKELPSIKESFKEEQDNFEKNNQHNFNKNDDEFDAYDGTEYSNF